MQQNPFKFIWFLRRGYKIYITYIHYNTHIGREIHNSSVCLCNSRVTNNAYHTYIHRYMQTYMQTYLHTQIYTNIHTYRLCYSLLLFLTICRNRFITGSILFYWFNKCITSILLYSNFKVQILNSLNKTTFLNRTMRS